MNSRSSALLITAFALVSTSCTEPPTKPPVANPYASYETGDIEFRDDVQTNATVDSGALDLTFLDTKGNNVKLADYRGKKNVVLVFTRGFSGAICPYCTTQTSRLIANYHDFVARDAEILLVYPGEKQPIAEFLAAVKEKTPEQFREVPFPVLLDESLDAVNRLHIRAELAAPSTYILDKQGQLRFAYVGANLTDRPSIAAMLAQLDAIQTDSAKTPPTDVATPGASDAKPGT